MFSFIHQHRLMVPAHLLQGLQRLKLERINLHTTTLTTATAAGPAIPAAAAAYAMSPSDEEQQHQDLLQQLAALTGLTSLSLHNCCINLASLSALTGLRDLDCSSTQAYEPTKAATSSSSSSSKEKSSSSIPNPADVAQALPHLEHLTGLSLSEKLCCDVTLAATSSLQRLQRLCLEDKGNLSSKAFAVLPLTLTLLELSCTWDIDYNIGPVETPGIAQLTALQVSASRRVCVLQGGLVSTPPTPAHPAMLRLHHSTLYTIPDAMINQNQYGAPCTPILGISLAYTAHTCPLQPFAIQEVDTLVRQPAFPPIQTLTHTSHLETHTPTKSSSLPFPAPSNPPPPTPTHVPAVPVGQAALHLQHRCAGGNAPAPSHDVT